MAVAEPRQHRRAGGRGLVAALQRLASLEQGEALRRVDAERLEHLGREHFAHSALERQAAVGMAAVRRLARTLRAKVEQAAAIVAELGEGEAAAVADLRVVHAELMPVVAQRQRLGEVVGQGSNRQKCASPVGRQFQPDALCPALVEKARVAFGKPRRLDRIEKIRPEREDLGVGPVARHRRSSGVERASSNPSAHELLELRECFRIRLVGRDGAGELAASGRTAARSPYAPSPCPSARAAPARRRSRTAS